MSGSCYTLLYGGETEPKTWGNYYRASFYREPREEDGGGREIIHKSTHLFFIFLIMFCFAFSKETIFLLNVFNNPIAKPLILV